MSDPQAWLESNIALVARVVARTARRCRVAPQDRDEVLSLVWSHLSRNDYRVLRQHRGDSTITTYLHVVVQRVVLDMQISRWGKWRPSAEARRLGEPAIRFERMVVRDGHRPAEARELLRSSGTALPTDVEARLVARRAPRRPQLTALAAASASPSSLDDPFSALLERQRARRGARLAARLERALAELPPADQLIIRMRHEQNLKVSQIAAMLGIEPKRLYRRLGAIHAQLKVTLTRLGVCPREAIDVTAGAVSHLPPVLGRSARGC